MVSNDYNRLIYKSGPITVYDYISSVPEKIHQKLFVDAMNKFYNEHPEFIDKSFRVIEIKNAEWWKFSKIRIIDTRNPLNRIYDFSLEDYWNNEFVKRYEEGNIPEYVGSNEDYIDYLDFMNGKAVMLNKIMNDKYKVDFKCLGSELKLSDEFDAYSETFEVRRKKNSI